MSNLLSIKKKYGALSGKMLHVRIVKNDKIDAYCKFGYVKVSFAPQGQERDKDNSPQGQSPLQVLEIEEKKNP